jgi:hypothetical protein
MRNVLGVDEDFPTDFVLVLVLVLETNPEKNDYENEDDDEDDPVSVFLITGPASIWRTTSGCFCR